MFTNTADVYDLVYAWKDYAGEASRLCDLIGRPGGTLLDVACGTGKHLEATFARAGLQAGYDEYGLMGRGLWPGLRKA